MPGVESGLCSCGNGSKTPRHVLIHCKKEESRRDKLRKADSNRLDLRKLLDTPEEAGLASRWVLRTGRLPQFSLTKALLYE